MPGQPLHSFSRARLPTSQSQALVLAAWTLRRALRAATACMTLQEGLYAAYTRDLHWLDELENMPDELRMDIRRVLDGLREAFHFDSATGNKNGASTLDEQEAATVLADLRRLNSKVEVAAAQE
jgi:hypothetical protein